MTDLIRPNLEEVQELKLKELNTTNDKMKQTHFWSPTVVVNFTIRYLRLYYPWIIETLPNKVATLIVGTNIDNIHFCRTDLQIEQYERTEGEDPESWTWDKVYHYHMEIFDDNPNKENSDTKL